MKPSETKIAVHPTEKGPPWLWQEYLLKPHGKRKDALLKRIMEMLDEVIGAYAEMARDGDAVAAARLEHRQAQKEGATTAVKEGEPARFAITNINKPGGF